jgi:signal transduction histidine kinase
VKIFINNKTIIVITVAFLTLTTYSYLLFFNVKTLQENHYCVNVNQQILSQTYTLLSQVKDIENVKLGYLITENDYYLELSNKVIPRINQQIDILHNLINNQEEYHNIKQLKILIGNSIANLKQIIHISHSNGYETALQFLKENQDQQLIETIINKIHKIETETLAELKIYSQKNQAIAQQTTLLNFAVTCLGFIFLGIATWKINHYNYHTIQLEKVNRQLEVFTYSTSHDLQEPLQIIEGFTLTIIEDYGNQIPDCALDYLQRILANSQRLQGLIKNLLNYTQLINQEIPTEPVNLALVISECLIQLNTKIQERQAQIIVKEPLPLVIANHLILVQVITNLLANAIKFVVPNQTPQIRIFATQKEEYIRLWIEDNGIGIPSEYKEEIFEVFKRLHGNDLYPGNGIGLAIVSKAMERMNGKCGVESQLNKGSHFWLELPLFREME